MKWLKRLLLFVLFFAVFAGALGIGGWWMSHRPPAWYAQRRASQADLDAAAHRAERQVQRTLSWAQDQQAFAASSQLGAPTTNPAKSLQISLSEDELNGFFLKWDKQFHWSDHYGQYFSEPQIVVSDGQLIVAATMKDLGSVMSIELQPRLKNEKLNMPVERILAGRLPLPRVFWDRYRQMLEDSVMGKLPDWQDKSVIRPNGTANSDTVAAAMGELLLDILNDHPARPYLFLPYDVSNSPRSLPVKLTGVEIVNKTLLLTLEPLTPDERQKLLQDVREPRVAQTDLPTPTATVLQ